LIDKSLGSIAARKSMYANKMGEGEPSASGRQLPMTATDLESDHAGGDGRFQLPYTRLIPLNSTQPAIISTQPAVISTQPAPKPVGTGAHRRLLGTRI
jgi:hypothetical protein